MIEVTVYQTLIKNKKIKIFTLIISEINKALQASSIEAFCRLSWLSECIWQKEDNIVVFALIIQS